MPNSTYNTGGAVDADGKAQRAMEIELLDEIPINSAATLDQLLGRFAGVRDGLPELVKNSKDQYSRLGLHEEADRQIVVISSTQNRSLAVVDFAGAPADNFSHWVTWSNPDTGQSDRAGDIEAGHGNGGKAFMVRGASKSAFMESCFEGKRTKMGFVNDEPSDRYKPGFAFSEGVKINNIEEPDPKMRLSEALELVSMTIDHLPEAAQRAFERRQMFTIVFLDQVNDWIGQKKSLLKNLSGDGLMEVIGTHGQTALSIESCKVWIVQDCEVIGSGPVTASAILPYQGFGEDRKFQIPDVLPDPATEKPINIFKEAGVSGYLRLCTSKAQMQITTELRARNVVRIRNERNIIANWTPQDLQSGTAGSFIYGELRCPSLMGEHLDGATRQHLADTPLVRALKEWTSVHVKQLADDLYHAMAENPSPRNQERARKVLNNIRDLMRQYLKPDALGTMPEDGLGGGHSGENGDGIDNSGGRIDYGTEIHEIILEPNLRDGCLVQGTKIPLVYRCVEHQEDGSTKPVRPKSLVLHSEPAGMFTLGDDRMLTAHTAGVGKIWLETKNGKVSSNQFEFLTVEATEVDADLPTEPLLQGQHIQLNFTFQTPDGPVHGVLIDGEILAEKMGAIGRNGKLIVGITEGVIELRIRYGEDPNAFRDFTLAVGSERVPPSEGTGNSGSDVPEIYFCNEEAPGMEEFPPEKRTITGGPEWPTIIEEPQFKNIVWINPSSKEAIRVRKSSGGSAGMGKVDNRTFMNFVALKCFEILKRLYVRQKIENTTVTETEFMTHSAIAEMKCAEFIDAAWEMMDDLLNRSGGSNE